MALVSSGQLFDEVALLNVIKHLPYSVDQTNSAEGGGGVLFHLAKTIPLLTLCISFQAHL